MSLRKEKSCGVVIVKEGKVLLVLQQSGFYGFPKGHVEKGETEIETAVREAREELGLDVVASNAWRFILHYTIEELNIDKEVVLFLADILGPEEFSRQEEEIDKIEWVDFDRVNEVFQREAWQNVWSEILPVVREFNR